MWRLLEEGIATCCWRHQRPWPWWLRVEESLTSWKGRAGICWLSLSCLTGYIISAAISFWGVAYAFGAKRMARLGIISIIFASIVYFSFTNLLGIQLPQWVLEKFISGIGK
ncbi:MAG: tripartite tricarboxylate transporter TctB family protein [Actinobacteria bacterium]|nr:tripartite tricarboxylate transporter TctB family protein [Actinomycetota bacterium]